MPEKKKGEWHIEVAAAQAIGSRARQEDNEGSVVGKVDGRPAQLVALADGMGGMKNGDLFSKTAVEAVIHEFVSRTYQNVPPWMILAQLTLIANREAAALQQKKEKGGTTLILALIVSNHLYFASVGDSRIDLWRHGTLLQLNRRHVLGDLLDERACLGVIDEEIARNSLCRNAISSSIGEERLKSIDLNDRAIHLMRDDYVVLMSDGVFGTLDDGEICGLIDPGESVKQTAEKIIRQVESKRKEKQDNATVAICRWMKV